MDGQKCQRVSGCPSRLTIFLRATQPCQRTGCKAEKALQDPAWQRERPWTGFQGRDDKGSFIVCLIALSTMVDFTLRTSDSCISLFITKDDSDGRSGTTMRSR